MDLTQLDTKFLVSLISLLCLILGFLFSRLTSFGSNFVQKHMEVLQQNTHAIIKLETQMELLIKRLDSISQLEKDVNSLGQRYRSLSKKINHSSPGESAT